MRDFNIAFQTITAGSFGGVLGYTFGKLAENFSWTSFWLLIILIVVLTLSLWVIIKLNKKAERLLE